MMDSQAGLRDASTMERKILILGGTGEARALAELLALRPDFAVTLSMAGRTLTPVTHAVPLRIGGFGGAGGLAAHLRAEAVDALVDATHPYAAQISANAEVAAAAAGVPLLALRRPGWQAEAGDQWSEVPDIGAAIAALGATPRRVFLAFGRREVAGFLAAPQHDYLIRSVDPIDPPLPFPRLHALIARGPFETRAEHAMLLSRRIEVIICKNSGGEATRGKLIAARELRLPVIMLARPALPEVETRSTLPDVIAWLDHGARLRGV